MQDVGRQVCIDRCRAVRRPCAARRRRRACGGRAEQRHLHLRRRPRPAPDLGPPDRRLHGQGAAHPQQRRLAQGDPPADADRRRARRQGGARRKRAAEERAAQADAVRRDRNLLQRFPDEAAHQRSREAALDTVRIAIRASELRLRNLAAERKPLMDEAEFYIGRPLPVTLKAQPRRQRRRRRRAAQRDADAGGRARAHQPALRRRARAPAPAVGRRAAGLARPDRRPSRRRSSRSPVSSPASCAAVRWPAPGWPCPGWPS